MSQQEFVISGEFTARMSGHTEADARDKLANALLDWDYVRSVSIGNIEWTDDEEDES